MDGGYFDIFYPDPEDLMDSWPYKRKIINPWGTCWNEDCKKELVKDRLLCDHCQKTRLAKVK